MPVRIQRSRAKGWRMPAGAIYVGRPTRWGNPFNWTEWPKDFMQDDARHAAVRQFRRCIHEFPVLSHSISEWRGAGGRVDILIAIAASIPAVLNELRGHDLACWCPLTLPDGSRCPCHADVLLELANA